MIFFSSLLANGVSGSKLPVSFGQWYVNGLLLSVAMTSYKKARSEEVSSLPLKSLRTMFTMFLVVLINR